MKPCPNLVCQVCVMWISVYNLARCSQHSPQNKMSTLGINLTPCKQREVTQLREYRFKHLVSQFINAPDV